MIQSKVKIEQNIQFPQEKSKMGFDLDFLNFFICKIL